MIRFRSFLASLALGATCAIGVPQAAQAADDVMVVFDGSNSMWGQIDGTAKIEIARGVMDQLLGEWTTQRRVGLMAYGHRRRGDCTDIETLIAPAEGTAAEILKHINAITPTGKTPLTDAVEMAAQQLAYTDRPATVVLISDGLESCGRDPCALAKALEKGGVSFTAHVVGFGLGNDADSASLSCIAEETGGQYIAADNAAELSQALSRVGDAVAQAPAAEPVAEPEPEPAPEPELPEITLTAPDQALAGSVFDVAWDQVIAARDYVTIVPMGSDEGKYANYIRVGDASEGKLQAPAETGMYELRYMLDEAGQTLGRRAIEITEPEVTVSGPQSVLAGEKFKVNWTGAVNGRDFVTIVPMGNDEGTYANYVRVSDASEGMLQAPAEIGMYELRYVLDEGRRTMARQTIEVAEPEVTVSGPQSVLAGAQFKVSWTGAVDGHDYITIVPMGSEEGKYANYVRVNDASEGKLQAPTEVGMYELRYALDAGRRTMARQTIEVTEPEVTVSGPAQIRAGDKLRVQWTGTVNSNDYIALAAVGSPDDKHESYVRVREDASAEMAAPEQPGMYELRYVLNEGRRSLARHMFEVLAKDAALNFGASIEAPDSGAPGAVIDVGWSVESDSADQRITLARADQAIFTWITAIRIEGDPPVQITLPSEAGSYELRFLDLSNQAVLARKVIVVQ